MDFSTINPVTILVAAAVAFVIGFMWHGPLFGKQWIKLMNIPQAEIDAARAKGMKGMCPTMLAAYLQQCVVAFVIAHLAGALGIATAMQAALFALLVWLGFIATALLNGVLWEKRSMALYIFGVAYHLVSIEAITFVVVFLK